MLVSLLKAIREGEPGDKVVLVSNYTESLKLCNKARGCRGGAGVVQCGGRAGGWVVAVGLG